jgi:glycosyltransferase involved in cell wall biosynthesis
MRGATRAAEQSGFSRGDVLKRRLVLFTPIPPAKTGTADYIDAFLASLPRVLTEHFRIVFAVDREHNVRPIFAGQPVVSSATCSLNPGDVALYFVANNHFHRHVFAALRRHDQARRAITLIHDLQCGMHALDACYSHTHGFARADVREFLSAELGDFAGRFAATAARGSALGSFARHLLLAQSMALTKSDLIVVHSHYARSKLLCEHAAGVRVPPIAVAEHPDLCRGIAASPHVASPQFVIGTFGWVAESKRTIELIRAFERFAQRRTDCALWIVGQLPPRSLYDPVGVAERSTVAHLISFFGYVDLPRFNTLMSQVDLMFALRFPSCGESSGAINRAKRFGVPLAISDYGAFREEPTAFLCRPDPRREQDDIVQAMDTAYEQWKTHGTTRGLATRRHYDYPDKQLMGDMLCRWLLRSQSRATG